MYQRVNGVREKRDKEKSCCKVVSITAKEKRDILGGKEKRENENFGVSSEVVRRTNVTCAPEPLQ